jgi:hypothetical protein
MMEKTKVLLAENYDFSRFAVELLGVRGFKVVFFGEPSSPTTDKDLPDTFTRFNCDVAVVDVESDFSVRGVDALAEAGKKVVVVVDGVFEDYVDHFRDKGVKCVLYGSETELHDSVSDMYRRVADAIDELVPRV